MEKFLFTDGSSEVREASSRKELEEFAGNATDGSALRVWIYGRNEWLSYAAFSAQYPLTGKSISREQAEPVVTALKPSPGTRRWKKRLLAYAAIAISIFLVFNFTKLRWEKPVEVKITASRPANVPYMDVDSLIADIESLRGEKIDRNTKSNLRLRNTWPDVIMLEASATRELSDRRNKFSGITIKVDNTTGHLIDEAIVMLNTWNNGVPRITDTIRFSNIGYNRSEQRTLDQQVKGDSITVAFQAIQAKAFNFCYSVSRDNPSGNYNDRWFCKNN